MDSLVHVANVLFVLSYSVRDILWLRVLTIVATGTLVPYYLHNALKAPVYWSGIFVTVNLVQLYFLMLERRPVRLRDDEQQLYNLAFRTLAPRDFVKLLKLARWCEMDDGEVLARRQERLDSLSILYTGEAVVSADGTKLARLGPGQFIGEMGYLTGQPSGADVAAAGTTRVVSWLATDLRTLLGKNLDLRAAVQNILGTDLCDKLRRPVLTQANA